MVVLLFLMLPMGLMSAETAYKIPTLNVSSPGEINSLGFSTEEFIGNMSTDVVSQYRAKPEKAVEEVQKLLALDPNLPQLTKGEIVEVLDNVTESREEHQRAMLLVMPYTPKNHSDLQELYTRPPVTHLVENTTKENAYIGLRPDLINSRPFKMSSETKVKPPGPLKRDRKPTEPPIPTKRTTIKSVTVTTTTTIRPETTTTSAKSRRKTPPSVNSDATSTQRYANHKYPDDSVNVGGMRIVSPPVLTTAPPDLSTRKPLRRRRPGLQSAVYKSTTRTTTTTPPTTSSSSIIDDIGIPQGFKDVVKGYDLPSESQDKPKYSSQYDASTAVFPIKQPETTESVRDILSSIGVFTTTTAVPDAAIVADNLSPDMKELLTTFGLLPNGAKKPETAIRPLSKTEYKSTGPAVVSPDSYLSFKPLPDTSSVSEDMLHFLAKFGLGADTGKRSHKSMKTDSKQRLESMSQLKTDMVPEHMVAVLEDIGITSKSKKTSESKKSEPTHVFNPKTTSSSSEEIAKLNRLIGTVKQLEKINGSTTEDELKSLDFASVKELADLLKKQNTSIPLDLQSTGPDPLEFQFGPEKNEVKRQELNSTSTSTTTTTTTTTITSTDEPRNPPISALEESFGGSSTTEEDPVTEAVPSPRPNGFYFLVDWNTFLEVGEDGKNKVNIRYAPRAGDPSRFLNVTVP